MGVGHHNIEVGGTNYLALCTKVNKFNYEYKEKFVIHIEVTNTVEILHHFCCFHVDLTPLIR